MKAWIAILVMIAASTAVGITIVPLSSERVLLVTVFVAITWLALIVAARSSLFATK